MNREGVNEIWAQVKENHKKLDSCNYHNFERVMGTAPMEFKCKHCGGIVNSTTYNWYMKGVSHGKENR